MVQRWVVAGWRGRRTGGIHAWHTSSKGGIVFDTLMEEETVVAQLVSLVLLTACLAASSPGCSHYNPAPFPRDVVSDRPVAKSGHCPTISYGKLLQVLFQPGERDELDQPRCRSWAAWDLTSRGPAQDRPPWQQVDRWGVHDEARQAALDALEAMAELSDEGPRVE